MYFFPLRSSLEEKLQSQRFQHTSEMRVLQEELGNLKRRNCILDEKINSKEKVTAQGFYLGLNVPTRIRSHEVCVFKKYTGGGAKCLYNQCFLLPSTCVCCIPELYGIDVL